MRFEQALALALASVWAIAPLRADTAQTPARLTLKNLTGQEESLSGYRGRIVVLNFWATWCVPCRKEMPVLVSLESRYAARGIQVIGASADDASTQEEVPRFTRRLKINFPVWVGATTGDMQALELGTALPATAIIDRDGQIAARILGMVKKGDLEDRIEWLLGDRRTPAPPALVNNVEEHAHGEAGEEHSHSSVGIEGASSVPS